MPLRSRVFKTRFLQNKKRVVETRNLYKIRIEFHSKKFYNTHQSIKTCQSSQIKNYQPSLSHPKHSTSLPHSPITLTPHCLSLSLTHNSHTTLSLTLTHHIASLTALPSQQIHISSKGFLI